MNILTDLRYLYLNPQDAVENFLKRPPVSGTGFFLSHHIPLLATLIFSIVFNPFTLWRHGFLYVKTTTFLPFILVIGTLLLSFLLDRLLENDGKNLILNHNNINRIKNISLFTHLPLSAVAPFFFIHPFLGYFSLLLAFIHSIYNTVSINANLRGYNKRRIILYYFLSVILLIIPLVVTLLFWNLYRSVNIISSFINN